MESLSLKCCWYHKQSKSKTIFKNKYPAGLLFKQGLGIKTIPWNLNWPRYTSGNSSGTNPMVVLGSGNRRSLIKLYQRGLVLVLDLQSQQKDSECPTYNGLMKATDPTSMLMFLSTDPCASAITFVTYLRLSDSINSDWFSNWYVQRLYYSPPHLSRVWFENLFQIESWQTLI